MFVLFTRIVITMNKIDKEFEEGLNQIVMDLIDDIKETVGDDNAYLNSLHEVD